MHVRLLEATKHLIPLFRYVEAHAHNIHREYLSTQAPLDMKTIKTSNKSKIKAHTNFLMDRFDILLYKSLTAAGEIIPVW